MSPLRPQRAARSIPPLVPVTLLLFFAVLLASLAPARSLDDLLHLAQRHDRQRQAELHSATAGEYDGLQLIAAYGPSVTLTAKASDTRHHSKPNSEEHVESSANFREGEALITLEQPLVDLVKGSHLLRGMVEMDIAVLLRDKAELDLRLRVGERCYGFLGARTAFDLAHKEGLALQQQAENVATRLSLGFDTITSLHEAKARQGLARAATISRRIELDNAAKALEELIGEALGEDVDDLAPDFVPAAPGHTQQWWLEKAQKGNSDLKIRRLQLEAAEYEYRAAQGQFLPSLAFYTSYRGRTSSDGLDGYGEDRDEFETGLRLDLQLLAGGRDTAAVLAAANRAKAARARLEASDRDVERRLLSLWQSVEHTALLVSANRHAASENEEALKSTLAAYDEGGKVLLDVLNAQQNHYRSLGAYLNSRYDYMLLLERLRHAAGGEPPGEDTELDAAPQT